jgi:hypothetical protein
MSIYLKDSEVKSIFRTWLKSTPSELPPGAHENLKKVVLIGFRCLHNNKDNTAARQRFFKTHTDLYTIDLAFKSNTGNDIAASLDLSKCDFAPDSFDSDKESPD